MKTIKIISVLFSIIVAFACNNQQSEKVENNDTAFQRPLVDEPVKVKLDTTEQKIKKSCEEIVSEIVKTSPRYKLITKGLKSAVVKNGGQTFGISLEGSPNPSKDKAWGYSKTYDFVVYEVYTDRQLNIARFSFAPQNKQLFEYDVVLDRLKPIEFNNELLAEFEAFCK